MIEKIVNQFEKCVYVVLIALLMLVLAASVFDLVFLLYRYLFVESSGLLGSNEIIMLLGAFLLVLIGVELLDTIKAYFKEHSIHVEIVILLAIIAAARKVILLDSTGMNGFEFGIRLMGNGVLILSLAAGYFIVKKAGISIDTGKQDKGTEKIL